MNAYCLTDVGRRRSSNQDYAYVSEEPVGNLPNLFVVADGMGGHAAGDLASRYAVEALTKSIRKEKREKNPIRILTKGIEKANAEVLAKAGTDPALRGMGTTLVAATVSEGCLYVANVGDSRLYLILCHLPNVFPDQAKPAVPHIGHIQTSLTDGGCHQCGSHASKRRICPGLCQHFWIPCFPLCLLSKSEWDSFPLFSFRILFVRASTAYREARSPAAWPPMPSATGKKALEDSPQVLH